MNATPIQAILSHQTPLDTSVTIEGWVRSRRTSKGGFSFIHVNDGSALDSVQAVADGALENYQSEILETVTGSGSGDPGRLGGGARLGGRSRALPHR